MPDDDDEDEEDEEVADRNSIIKILVGLCSDILTRSYRNFYGLDTMVYALTVLK